MSPKIIKAASDPVIGGAVRSFVDDQKSGWEFADAIVQARANGHKQEALELASAFDLARKKGGK